MSLVTFHKQGCESCKRNIEEGYENDMLVENINTGLILFLGVLSLIASVVLLVYSAVLGISRQQFLMEFLKTLIFAGPLLATGLGSLYYLFRKRRRQREHKDGFIQKLSFPQTILCEKCGATLYEGIEGSESISPYEIVKKYGGRCPECGELLSSAPTDFEVKQIAVPASQESR